MVFSPAGEDGANDKIKPEERIPVAIRLCRLATMKTCEFSSRYQMRDLIIGNIGEESGTETNGGDVDLSEHDAVKMIVQ